MPSPGKIIDYHQPGGPGVRVDSAIYSGYNIPPFYDSLIGKLIVHDKDRNSCIARLACALKEYTIAGIKTTVPLHQRLIKHEGFIKGDYHIHWLENMIGTERAELAINKAKPVDDTA